MRVSQIAAALGAAAFSVAIAVPTLAADAPKGRFSDVRAYTGDPALSLTLSTVIAGGGPEHFDTTKLLAVLAGDKFKPEVDKLTKQYGAEKVKSFIEVFDFVINDSLRIVTEKKAKLPSAPAPSPKDGKALAAALYKAGLTSEGTFDVEYMLDGLVTHPIHVAVMDDIDKKYSRKADAEYHIILTQAMTDLKAVYGL